MASPYKFICLEPSQRQIDLATTQVNLIHQQSEATLGHAYLRGSFKEGAGDLPGKTAEIAVGDFYAPYLEPTTGAAIYGQDFFGAPLRPDDGNRPSTYDNKSVTMYKDYVPGPNHNAHITQKSAAHQTPDFFIFTRTHVSLKFLYIVGFLSYDEFFRRATLNVDRKSTRLNSSHSSVSRMPSSA